MIYFIIAVVIVLADQAVKYLITLDLVAGEQIALIPGIIHLTYVENTGAAFSILSDMRWVLVAVSSIASLVIIYILIKYKSKMELIGKLSLAFILGGALGNLIDRAVMGYVVDVFEVEFIRFAVFNVADCFITIGGIAFCFYYFIHTGKQDKAKKSRGVVKTGQTEDEKQSWSETEILEEYDLERQISENDDAGDEN
jgi:signal peptidase II